MTRYWFGDSDDWSINTGPSGDLRRVPSTRKFYDAETGGNQYTDLLLGGTLARTEIVSGGLPVRFQGPDGVLSMWASDNGGPRVLIQSTDIPGVVAEAAEVAVEARQGAEAVGTVVDSQIAGRINASGSATDVALKAAISTRAPAVTLVEKGADPTGATANNTEINAAITASLAGRALRPTKGTYVTGPMTTAREISVPAAARWSLDAEPGAVIKAGTNAMSTDNQVLLGVVAGGADVERVDIRGLALDGNRRGQTLPAGPQDWEHNALLRIGSAGNGTTNIKTVVITDLDCKDPVADCVWVPRFYVEHLIVDNMVVRDRAGTRSDITLSGMPRVTQISNFIGYKLEIEPLGIPAAITWDFLYQVNQAYCATLLDLLGPTTGDRLRVELSKVTCADLSLIHLNGYMRDSKITFPLNAYNTRSMQNLGEFLFDNCDIYLTADASDVVAPMNITSSTARQARVKFKNCRFHLVPQAGHAGPFTGAALKFGTWSSGAPNPDYTVEDCWFDPRFEYSVDADRCGSLKLRNNTYGGVVSAVRLTQSATLQTLFLIDGGDWTAVTGNFATLSTAVGGETHLRNVVVSDLRAKILTVPGATVPLWNNRVQIGAAAPGAATPGLRGDTWRLQTPLAGQVNEWLCTVSSATAATWEAKGVKELTSTTAALAAIGDAINTTGKYLGKTVYNTTTKKRVTADGATAVSVWVDATGTTAHTPV